MSDNLDALLRWMTFLAEAYADRATTPLDLVRVAEEEVRLLLPVADEEPCDFAGAPLAFLSLWAEDEAALNVLAAALLGDDLSLVPGGLAQALRAADGIETFEEACARETREAEARRRAWKDRPKETRPLTAARREQRRILLEVPEARERLGELLNGKVCKDSVRGVLCPGCGRATVWWWIEPTRMRRWRCKHRNSCGATGHLWELVDGSLAVRSAVQ